MFPTMMLMNQRYKEMRLGTLNYLQCRNFYLLYRITGTKKSPKVVPSTPHAGITHARKCLSNFDKDFPKKCYNCQIIKNYIVMGQVYHCNFCGRPLSPFKGGKYRVAEIHHLNPIQSKTARASTWKRAIKKELGTGKEQLEIICAGKGTCHKLAHLTRTAKILCPDCAKKGLLIGLQRVQGAFRRGKKSHRKRDYVCPKCGKKWFKSTTGLIPLSQKKGGLKTCPFCSATLNRNKRRHYTCPQCGSAFMISQSKKKKGQLTFVP